MFKIIEECYEKKEEVKSDPMGNIRNIDSPNPPSLQTSQSAKNYTWARNNWPDTLSFFNDVINIKMGSNGAATASEHTYVLVTGANR
jgi:hypothetical protein